MKRICAVLILLGLSCQSPQQLKNNELADDIENILLDTILHAWYPRAVDVEFGGFITSFDFQWRPSGAQEKMIVTQARHVWTTSKAAHLYPDDARYLEAAAAGFQFLKEKMWDYQYGGFYQYRGQDGGEPDETRLNYKTSYGNAFGLYAASAYYELTHDPAALDFAQQIFSWFEEYAHDTQYGGYFQNFNLQNEILATSHNSGFLAGRTKDQNTSIHILEAFTELYKVWPDVLVRQRLHDMLFIIRDKITRDFGSLTLFLEQDWRPISLQDSSETYIRDNVHRDHISAGHDVETAFLMLEASHALGFEHDDVTLAIAKKMVDHAIQNAWDDEFGGLYEIGFYFKNDAHLTIVTDYKSWWTQMEALNAFLIMSLIFPEEPIYYQKFVAQWDFIKTYVIDFEHGGVYSRPLDRKPDAGTFAKAQAWKGPYHTVRALMNGVKMVRTRDLPF